MEEEFEETSQLSESPAKSSKVFTTAGTNFYGPTILGNNNRLNLHIYPDDPHGPENVKKIPGVVENFIGREDILTGIGDALLDKMFVNIHGMVGVGKSTVAAKFANEQSTQYVNMIWVDMKQVYNTTKEGQFLNEIYQHISRELCLNISSSNDDDIRHRLQLTFRKLCTAEKQTLIILDNCEEYLAMEEDQSSNPLCAMKSFVEIATRCITSKGWIHILCTSRCSADEQYFNNSVKNIKMLPFTPEESGRYLESVGTASCEKKEILHKSSSGYPLILSVFSKVLNAVQNERDVQAFLDQCRKHPGEAAIGSSPHVKDCLNAALRILGDKEMKLAIILSFFKESFSFYFASELCSEVGSKASYLYQLMDKGIIYSTKTGFAMQPFLQEIIHGRVPDNCKLRYKTALTVVYIRHLLKLGEGSFEKDNLSSTVKGFHDIISPFNHLIGILHSYSVDEIKIVRSMIEEGVLKEQEPCSFCLLLKFLYPLVEGIKIRSIFEFLRDASNGQDTRSMICACLDELDWNISDCSAFRENFNTYEFVMLRRRQLSEKVTEVRRRTEKDVATCNNLKEDLLTLLETVKSLENKKFKAYYTVKVIKLLGKVASYANDLNEAERFFKSASELSDSTFGATSWTIDIYNCLAECQAENGNSEGALKLFEKAFDIAKDIGLIDSSLICTLFWPYSMFCLKHEKLKDKAIAPLKKITEISYHCYNFQFFSKALGTLCSNFTQYSQVLTKDIDSLVLPDNVLIRIVDNVSKHMLQITGRTADKEIIQKETMIAVDILSSAIFTARRRMENDSVDTELLVEAIFKWYKNIALYCAHVMLESDRKPYAEKALKIAEEFKFDNKYDVDVHYLSMTSTSNNTKEVEQMILEVTFLEKTNKIMANTGQHIKQKERINEALANCQLEWLKLKLLTCLLELANDDHKETIQLMKDIGRYLSDGSNSPFKPFYVIYKAIQNIELSELSDEERLILDNVLQHCIRKFNGLSQTEKDMKCKFQIIHIALLRKSSFANPGIMSLMQTVLWYGNKRRLREIEKVEKEYQQYIKDHTPIFSKIWNFIKELMIF